MLTLADYLMSLSVKMLQKYLASAESDLPKGKNPEM